MDSVPPPFFHDILMLSWSCQQVKEDNPPPHWSSFGLKINAGKTKSMSIVNSSRQSRPNAIVLNGHPVEVVNQFTDVDYRVRKAKVAFGIL